MAERLLEFDFTVELVITMQVMPMEFREYREF